MTGSSCLGTAATLVGLVVGGGLLWAVTLGGYSLDDPEIDEARFWVQDFKYEHPELARQFGRQCAAGLSQSGWTRDGALELFTCIRAKAEAQRA